MNPDHSECWVDGAAGREIADFDAFRRASVRARLWSALLIHLPADATGAWLLFEEQGIGRAVRLEAETIVGRGEEAGLRPECRWLSRRHFRLFRNGDWHLEDLGGRNPVRLNDQPVPAPHRLVSGDVIQVADFPMLFFLCA